MFKILRCWGEGASASIIGGFTIVAMIPRSIISWLKARDLAEIALGGAIGFLTAGALFTTIQMRVASVLNERAQAQINRAIESAQLQVADAISEAHKFRASLFCAAETIVDGCKRWEPRVRP